MGKRTKLREAQRRADEQALAARLRFHKHYRASAAKATWRDVTPDDLAKITAYQELVLRPYRDWRGRDRVRGPESRFLELVKFTFARFAVPRHLERAWLLDPPVSDAPDFRRWYIVVAQGGSLHRHGASQWLTRAEVHHFLNAPGAVKSAQRAIWYAVALAEAPIPKAAIKVARSRIVEFSARDPFWRAVARFLARNPIGVLEMNDLVAFFSASRAADPAYSLQGRTLAAVRRRMVEWQRHHWLVRKRWVGIDLPNTTYDINGAVWRFKQIRNNLRLLEEGRRMHHCAAGYADLCSRGETTIWSLSCFEVGRLQHRLTIEVDANRTIWQVRGFANRSPSEQESAVVRCWARDLGLAWREETLRAEAAE